MKKQQQHYQQPLSTKINMRKITFCFVSVVTLLKYVQQIGASYNGEFGRSGDHVF